LQPLSARRRRLLILLTLVGMAAYVGFALAVDAAPIRDGVARLGVGGCAAVLGLSLFNYGARFWRWAAYLRRLQLQVPPGRHLLYYVGGFALTVSPGKAGEALRSIYLHPHGVPWSASFAALLAERLMDVLAMVVLALLLVASLASTGPAVAAIGIAFVAITFLSGHPGLPRLLLRGAGFGHAVWRQLLRGAASTFESSAVLLQARVVAPALALGVVAWGAEGYGLYLIAQGLGLPLDPLTATGIYAVAVLGGVASFFLPGGLGGMEAAMIALLMVAGATVSTAFAIAVLCRIATLWFAVVLGILALVWLELLDWKAPAKDGV
jgi:glycosyltransferase 2 family protein